jgi:hypothetical protein
MSRQFNYAIVVPLHLIKVFCLIAFNLNFTLEV